MPTAIVLAVFAAGATLRSVELRYRAAFFLEIDPENLLRWWQPIDLDKERRLLFSSEVLDPILADPALRTAPSLSDPNSAEANLRNNLSMDFAGPSYRLIVCYQDTEPEAAARVCNAVVDSYLRQRYLEEPTTTWNSARWLEPEIKHWESEVEQGRKRIQRIYEGGLMGYQPANRSENLGDSAFALRTQLRSQVSESTFQLALLNAQITEHERLIETGSMEEIPAVQGHYTEAEELNRQRALLVAKLEILNKEFDEGRSQLERLGGNPTLLLSAQEGLAVASDILTKLRSRVATLQAESRQDWGVRVLAPATPPRDPINWPPIRRMAVFSGIAFFSPLMLGFLLGFRRDVVTQPR